jgi:hypothetical protein
MESTTSPNAEKIVAALIAGHDVSENRKESLTLAAEAGATVQLLEKLRDAVKLTRNTSTIVLPPHHYEGLSRGRGWCRKGKGDSAQWGDRCDKGYRVGPGRWVVGGHDGFTRKASTTWDVENITVGGVVWTIAN